MNSSKKSTGLWFFLLAACLLLGGYVSIKLGQDANWDLKNYHLYSAWSYLNHRLHIDLFVAGTQSYFAPLLDIPYYLLSMQWLPHSPRLLAFIVGVPYGILIFMVFSIAWVIIGNDKSTKPGNFLLSAIVTAFGVTGAATVSQVGTTFNEIQIAAIILTGLLLLVLTIRIENSSSGKYIEKFYIYLILSGFLFGAAAGLKLTACIYAPGAALVVAAINGNYRQRFYRTFLFTLTWFVSFLLLWGSWGFELYKMSSNPFLPLFNSIFNSPWIAPSSSLDTRFIPKGIMEAIIYPFYWINNPAMTVMEVSFADPRFAITFFLAIIVIIFYFSKLFRSSGRTKGDIYVFRPVDGVLLFFAISYPVWESLFSILRYAVTLESILGIIVYSLAIKLYSLLNRNANYKIILSCIIILFVSASLLTKYPDWGRVKYSEQVFNINHPAIPENTLVLFIGKPIAYLAPFLSQGIKNIHFIGMSDATLSSSDYELGKKVQREISEWRGPIFYVVRKESLVSADLLNNYSLYPAGNCSIINSNIDENNFICPATKIPNLFSWPTLTANNYYILGDKIGFATGDQGQNYTDDSWSSPETWGTWTEASTANLLLSLPVIPSGNPTLQFKSHAFLVPAHPSLNVTVTVNGQLLQTFEYRYPQDTTDSVRTVNIPAELVAKSKGLFRVAFAMKTPASPASVGVSADSRTLGLGMAWLKLTSVSAQ